MAPMFSNHNCGSFPGESGVIRYRIPTPLSWIMWIAETLLLGIAVYCVSTRVHSKLLRMTFSTFDPWAIIACVLRAWAAKAFSRHFIHLAVEYEREVHVYIFELLLELAFMVELSSLLIITEAADVPKDFKRGWDRGAKLQLDFLFFVSMTPLSQYIGAFQVIAALLAKAAVSVIIYKILGTHWQDFMYLRCHYDICLDQLETCFVKLAVTDPSAALPQDLVAEGEGQRWLALECVYQIIPNQTYSEITAEETLAARCNLLQSWGISEDHIYAGFNRLDDHALFTRFCQSAFEDSMSYASLSSMLATVFGQWRKIRIDQFGKMLNFTRHREILNIFKRDRMRTQALLFGAFIHAALDSLREKNFTKTSLEMTSVGLRHRHYGIKPQYLCLFQLSILNTLDDQLNGLSLHSEIAWSVVWTNFVTTSFLRGLLHFDEIRSEMVPSVLELLQEARKRENCVKILVKNMKMMGGPRDSIQAVFRDEEHEQRHLGMLLGYLEQVLRKLQQNQIASARKTIRLAAKVHWDRKMPGDGVAGSGGQAAGVDLKISEDGDALRFTFHPTPFDPRILPRYMLTFQHAMALTFKEMGLSFPQETETKWMVFMHCEVLEILLLEPFAGTQRKVEEWASSLGTDEVDFKAWKQMQLAQVDDKLAEIGWERLHVHCSKPVVQTHDVIKLFGDKGMQHSSWTFERVIQDYCQLLPPGKGDTSFLID
eukprot:s127_g8.t1